MRRALLAALLLGCRGDKNDLGVPKGCPPQFDDADPVIRDGIRRRLNELDLPPEERPKYRWPNRTAFAWPGDDPPLWDPWFNINTSYVNACENNQKLKEVVTEGSLQLN